eukprot:gene5557-9375_t
MINRLSLKNISKLTKYYFKNASQYNKEFTTKINSIFIEEKLNEINELLKHKNLQKNNDQLPLLLCQRTQLFYHLGYFSEALKESSEVINLLEDKLISKTCSLDFNTLESERVTNFFLQEINKYFSDVKLNEKDKKILKMDETSLSIIDICESFEKINSIIEELLSNHQDTFLGKLNLSKFYLKNRMRLKVPKILNNILETQKLEQNSLEYAQVIALKSNATKNEELALEAMKIFKEKNQYLEYAKTVASMVETKRDLNSLLTALKLFWKNDSTRELWSRCFEKYLIELIHAQKDENSKKHFEIFLTSFFSKNMNRSIQNHKYNIQIYVIQRILEEYSKENHLNDEIFEEMLSKILTFETIGKFIEVLNYRITNSSKIYLINKLRSSIDKNILKLLFFYHLNDYNNDQMQHFVKKISIQKTDFDVYFEHMDHMKIKLFQGICFLFGYGLVKNEKMAFNIFSELAENNDPVAQFYIARCYKEGHGIKKNLKKEVEFYKLSANQGYSHSQNSLGFCYEFGNGVEKNISKAVELYSLSAERGNPRAQNNLALCYQYGSGVEIDFKKAFQLFELSSNQGTATAQFNLGVCYQYGNGVEEDFKKAVRLFKLSAEQGDPQAQFNLACYYQFEENDMKKAVELYILSSDQGDSDAQLNLGCCYVNEEGVEQNEKKAIELFKLSANQGNSNGQLRLGYCYEHGEGVEQDLNKAISLYRLSANQENPSAKYNLEMLLMNIENNKKK